MRFGTSPAAWRGSCASSAPWAPVSRWWSPDVSPIGPGSGIVFLAPVKGRKVTAAAAVAGLGPTAGVAALRIEGTDRPGLGAKITGAIADAHINLRGLSAAVVGGRFAAHLAFDSREDAEKAAKAVRAAAAAKPARKKSGKR